MLTFGSLFAGIGGFDLGLERAGMVGLWQVEIDDYCNRVLEKHWPDVRRYRDVRETHGILAHAERDRLERRAGVKTVNTATTRQWSDNETRGTSIDGDHPRGFTPCPSCLPPVDLIAGGFPCQPFSAAGKRRGKDDDRNLWPEFKRIIDEVRPRWVIAENVPSLRTLYLDTVLSDLEGLEYTAETIIIPACAFDAPHRRDRLWIVANTRRRQQGKRGNSEPMHTGRQGATRSANQISGPGSESPSVADAETQRLQGHRSNGQQEPATRQPQAQPEGGFQAVSGGDWWTTEPDVGRVAHGIPARVDRLRALGNAVVPQVVEHIGRLIIAVEETT